MPPLAVTVNECPLFRLALLLAFQAVVQAALIGGGDLQEARERENFLM